MTRKDFQVVAAALGKALRAAQANPERLTVAIQEFADGIAHTNPNFKRNVFEEAVFKAYSA